MNPEEKAKAILERKKNRQQGRPALPPLPAGPVPPGQPRLDVSAGQPLQGSGAPSPAKTSSLPKERIESSAGKGRNKRATPEDGDSVSPGRRESSRLRLQDALLEMPLKSTGIPTPRATRSSGEPPLAILKSKELDPMKDFLQSLPNSSDQAILEATEPSRVAEAALLLLPKFILTATSALMSQASGENPKELRAKLNAARASHSSDQKAWVQEKQQLLQEVEGMRESLNSKTAEVLDLEGQLRATRERQSLMMQETLRSERAEWLAGLESSAEGQALLALGVERFRQSLELTALLEDANEEGFDKGFRGCLAQVVALPFPLSDAAAVQVDYMQAFAASLAAAQASAANAPAAEGTSAQPPASPPASLPAAQPVSTPIISQIVDVANALATSTPPPAQEDEVLPSADGGPPASHAC